MLTSLQGKWCLVLGASSGMGEATARAWARAGGNVLGVHFDTAERQEKVAVLQEELRSQGGQAHFFNANAASADTRAELVPAFAELVGDAGIRVLMHSLAFGSLVPFIAEDKRKAFTPRQMDMTLNVMAHSLVYWTQDVHRAGLLRRGAKIFAMTSAGDEKVSPNYGGVSAAKCALESHVRQLALELAPEGISANSLRAGVTVTPSLERIPEHERLVELATRTNPHGRLTRCEDVAEAVVLLSSTDSSWITGNVIGVDGGEALTA
ncbi:SDR family oxidoreductase [Saccharothrix algeriensis]|uniref:NAD(P)-dependent dehydrogenase (Short-subunit alcohol dehydrogenase family) n=1 Tax=Saccharothrix algeriensis TaxID=173560 RepID=A0A8T8I3E3_9PSEU|nr:SDR family oxidoreductase [Saccharothrix algeriensis]MBM7810376.1 NAD(P)-dependent dehydrogenase (short-subunit alcohol dehydrogenase family) [Saccharothrix algeriensis]QTR04514.1 SDR family oxidoreductase [Saccharothrix algeriensis]